MSDPPSSPTTTTTTCGVCDKVQPQDSDLTTIDFAKVCNECMQDTIKPKFLAALQNERDYPAWWSARVVLRPEDNPGLLSESFHQEWQERLRMYNTPSEERIFCLHSVLRAIEEELEMVPELEQAATHEGGKIGKCGAFIGARVVDGAVTLVCKGCAGEVCSGCGESLASRSQHSCDAASSATVKSKCDEIEGLVRGVDFQVCPGCSMGAALRDVCNAVWCDTCAIYFCYICGVEADDGSAHWAKGSACPRYNAQGAADAHFDLDDDEDGGVENQDDAGDDDEDDSELEDNTELEGDSELEGDLELEDGEEFGLNEEFRIAENQPHQEVDEPQQPLRGGLDQSHDGLRVQEPAAVGTFVGAVPVFRDFREFLHWRLNNTPAPEDT